MEVATDGARIVLADTGGWGRAGGLRGEYAATARSRVVDASLALSLVRHVARYFAVGAAIPMMGPLFAVQLS